MTRKVKMLTAVIAAALTATALAAPTAQAAEFTSAATHTLISGSQGETHQWTAAPGYATVTCTTIESLATAEQHVFTWIWLLETRGGECKDSLGRTVHHVGCKEVGNRLLTSSGSVHSTCKGGTHDTVTHKGSVVCTATYLTPQVNSGVTYKSLGGTKGIEVIFNITNTYSTTEGGFFNCGTTNGMHSNGSYYGTTVLTGINTLEEPVGLAFD